MAKLSQALGSWHKPQRSPELEGIEPAIRCRNGERAWFHQSSADEAQEGSNCKACVVAYARDFCPL